MSAADSANEELNALVLECVQRFEREGDTALDDVCRAHPEHAARLRARVTTLRDMGLLGGFTGLADARDEAPERLGEFRLLERLGGGGMGVVYLAEQTTLGRRVALKLIRPEQLFFPGARERFQREVEAVAQLAHPGIVPIHTVGEERGVPYFAMEHIEGASLAEVLGRLRGRTLESLSGRDLLLAIESGAADDAPTPAAFARGWIDACLAVALAVARALEHAHERGVLHRDIKPSNVMLTRHGRVALLDFGLARREGASALTRSGAQQGSLPYMAPEQIDGNAAAIGTRTDVYALGVTLYELLTLRAPFEATSTEQLMRRISSGERASPRKLNPAVSADVASVCAMAMDAEPARRYASAERFAADLENLLARRPVDARPAGLALRARRFAQRHPAATLAAALGALIVIGGPLLFAVQEVRAAGRIGRERDVAQSERDRAERNFSQALAAVDALLARVGEERLDRVPQMEVVRHDLIEDALRFYNELAAQKPDDVALRIEGARLDSALAKTLHQLGRDDEALAHFGASIATLRVASIDAASDALRRQYLAKALISSADALCSSSRFEEARRQLGEARALLETLAETGPDADESRRQLIVALSNLALLLRDGGQLAEAANVDRDAIERSAALLVRLPDDVELQALHATSLAGAGVVARMRGDLVGAEDFLRRALPLMEELARAAPDDRRRQSALVDAYGNLGYVLTERGAAPEAEALMRKGLAAAEHLVASYPNSPQYLKSLGDIGINLGMLLANLARFDDARVVLEPAVATLARLADAYPQDAEYRANLGVALSNMGSLFQDFDHIEAGRAYLTRGAECERAALELRPGNPVYQRHLAILHMNLGEGWVKQSAHAAAAVELTRVLPLCNTDGRVSRYLTALWVRCATLARADETLGTDERERLAQEHLSRALATLRAAIQAGYADFADLRSSAELEPLRTSEGFAELMTAAAPSRAR